MVTQVLSLYHCSPFKIDKFNFEKGVHFGGKASAIKAGKRKLYNLKTYHNHNRNSLYLYKVQLHIENVEEVFDLGDDWVGYKNTVMLRDNLDAVLYTNKYELDVVKSYYVVNPLLCTIISVESFY